MKTKIILDVINHLTTVIYLYMYIYILWDKVTAREWTRLKRQTLKFKQIFTQDLDQLFTLNYSTFSLYILR